SNFFLGLVPAVAPSLPPLTIARQCSDPAGRRADHADASTPRRARRQAITRLTAAASGALVLAGCASFSPDGGLGKVSELTKERTGQAVSAQRTESDASAARTRVAEILKEPLTPDTAAELALLNNRGLQASFAQLGIAEADLVQAGRLRNPLFSFGRLSGGGV